MKTISSGSIINTKARGISGDYPFGSVISDRTWSDQSRNYRFGFNGKEKDFETASDNYDFGARIYDGRLGRWLSLDFLQSKSPSCTPFIYCYNNSIYFRDADGHEGIPHNLQRAIDDAEDLRAKGYNTIIQIDNDGKITLIWYKTVVSSTNPSGGQGYTVGIAYNSESEKYKQTKFDKFIDYLWDVDNWINMMQGNAEWKLGIRIVGLKGGNNNKDASKLSADGKYIEVGEEVIIALSTMQKADLKKMFAPEKNKLQNPKDNFKKLQELTSKLKGLKSKIDELKQEGNKKENIPTGRIIKQNIEVDNDGKAYRIDSLDGKTGWHKHEKDTDTEDAERAKKIKT